MQLVDAALLLQRRAVNVQIGFAQEAEPHLNVRRIGTPEVADLPRQRRADGIRLADPDR